MILEKAVIFAAIIISYFMQTSVGFFELGSIKPNFTLILIIYYGVHKGSFSGVWLGFLSGLLLDINLGEYAGTITETSKYYIGTYTLPASIIGYFSGKLSKGISKENIMVLAVAVFCMCIALRIIFFIVVAIFHGDVAGSAIITKALPEAFYTGLISLLWFKVLQITLPQIDNSNTFR